MSSCAFLVVIYFDTPTNVAIKMKWLACPSAKIKIDCAVNAYVK